MPEHRTRFLWPLAVCLVTAAAAAVPLLFSPTFYLRGDSGAQFAPTWYHLGELVRGGAWPPLLDPGAWAGGNYVAEGLFGVYNPLNLLIWLTVSGMGSLLVSVWVVKAAVMALLALGTYLVSLEYGAERWAAAAVAVALPVSGFTLFWDAGSWAAGLIAFAYAPWVWWSFRRALRGTANPVWAVLVGVLAVTQGNPYGTLAVVVVGVSLLVEGMLTGNGRGAGRLVLVGLSVAAFLPLVYLPLLETVGLATRSGGPLFMNNGKMRPELGDLLGLSSPVLVPDIRAITGATQVPTTYFAWFVVPLLPWLRPGALRRHARPLAGVAAFTLVYFLLTLGPSKLWLFRWPLRLVEYLYLGLAVALAVTLSVGLARDRWLRRSALSAGLVAALSWLTWAQQPEALRRAVIGALLLAGLTALVLAWHRWARATTPLAAILAGGCVLVLGAQVAAFGENGGSRPWFFPHDVSALQQRFDERDGTVVQLANLRELQEPGRFRELRAAWDDYLAGSMYQVAGVEAVNNYTGMGFDRFTRLLCMNYDGFTKPCGYRNLWRPVSPGGPPLVDLMKVDRVVVQPAMAGSLGPPPGWEAEVSPDGGPVVLTRTRTRALPWPGSRLSEVPEGVVVDEAATVGRTEERVRLSSTGGGGLAVFAAIGWPGYTATLDGRPLETGRDAAGLLTVLLPADGSGVLEVTFAPPGLATGLAGAGAGALGALALGLAHLRRRRRGEAETYVAPREGATASAL